jgi:hypothetical protein
VKRCRTLAWFLFVISLGACSVRCEVHSGPSLDDATAHDPAQDFMPMMPLEVTL